jgi:ABC-type antimicrobial peptide transport system permease subunit
MVLSEGGGLLAVGLVLGALGSVLASRVLDGLLFGVATRDPVTLAAVALIMAVVGLTATWVPAVRASSIQPVEALRSE